MVVIRNVQLLNHESQMQTAWGLGMQSCQGGRNERRLYSYLVRNPDIQNKHNVACIASAATRNPHRGMTGQVVSSLPASSIPCCTPIRLRRVFDQSPIEEAMPIPMQLFMGCWLVQSKAGLPFRKDGYPRCSQHDVYVICWERV